MEFRPSFASFVGSSLYGFTPALLAGTVMYFLGDSARWIVWAVSSIMVVMSLFLFLQAIFVHRQKLYLDDYRICIIGSISTVEIRWQDVVSAELRERENLMSRTDHLLVISSVNHILSYNTHTLSREDESRALQIVERKTNLIIRKDKPSI